MKMGFPEPDVYAGKSGVFIVDDHPLVREWLSNLVNGQMDLAVCGEAEDAARALAGIGQARPQIAVVDLALKSGSGLELVKDIKLHHPGVGVIVLSMHDESLYAERALRAGARGYVMKRETTKKILAAIRCVLEGGVYVSEGFAATIAEKLVSGAPLKPGTASVPAELLSDRELEVFVLLGKGRSTPQIAEMLGISPKTVQAYCARIKEKLGLSNATELLRAALRFEESNSVGQSG
jgi:DNA-binding NarL/FixJ family response regulator